MRPTGKITKRALRKCFNCKHFIKLLNDEKTASTINENDIMCHKIDSVKYDLEFDPETIERKKQFKRLAALCQYYRKKNSYNPLVKKWQGKYGSEKRQKLAALERIDYDKTTLKHFRRLDKWKQDLLKIVVNGEFTDKNGNQILCGSTSNAEAYRMVKAKYDLPTIGVEDKQIAYKLINSVSGKDALEELRTIQEQSIRNSALRSASIAQKLAMKQLDKAQAKDLSPETIHSMAEKTFASNMAQIKEEKVSNNITAIQVTFGDESKTISDITDAEYVPSEFERKEAEKNND